MASTPEHTESTSTSTSAKVGPAAGGPSAAADATRSEERLVVSTRRCVSGRAVLRKYVVTEIVTQTFEVRHEEVRVEQEPAPGSSSELVEDGSTFGDQVIEVVLHREVPVVQMNVIAVEKVRLRTDVVTRQVQVSEQLRKEQVEISTPDDPARR